MKILSKSSFNLVYSFRRTAKCIVFGGIKKIRKERIELFHECMSSLLLSKPGSSLVRNYAPPDTFQFPVTDLTTPTRKRFNRHLIRARVRKHPRFFHASSSLPRIFEEREGVERWNGNHLRSAAAFRRVGRWFEQTTCYTPAAYLWEQRNLEEACSGTSVWLLSSAATKFDSVHDFKAWS